MLLLALPPLGFSTPPTPCRLPSGSLIAGYATSCDSDGAPHLVEQAVAGVNVVIWFATSLQKNATSGRPQVTHHLNHTCVAVVAQELRRRGLITAHMISIGGWDAPHPDTSFSGEEWFEAWDEWNRGEVAQPALGFPGYDGIDWDLEGNDTPSSPWNRFTPACIELVGTMSQAAKRAGYLVSLVPPQSYADVGVAGFDLSLRHSYPEWQPVFQYRGRNAYMVWLSDRYGTVDGGVPTFDFVDVQLYETFSHASYAIDGPPQTPPARYLAELARAFARGWRVTFGNESVGVASQTVAIPPQRLLLGFSFGSNPAGRSVFIRPSAVAEAWESLAPDERPRGVMFWNMDIDGHQGTNGTNATCNLAAGFNSFLHVRETRWRR